MRTNIQYQQEVRKLTISAAQGSYAGAPEQRSYSIHVYGLSDIACAIIGDGSYPIILGAQGDVLLSVPATPIAQPLEIHFAIADGCSSNH